MSSTLSPTMQEEVRILLLRASEQLPQGQDVFHMFGTFKEQPDLIFKVSSTRLSLITLLHFSHNPISQYTRNYHYCNLFFTCFTHPLPHHTFGKHH